MTRFTPKAVAQTVMTLFWLVQLWSLCESAHTLNKQHCVTPAGDWSIQAACLCPSFPLAGLISTRRQTQRAAAERIALVWTRANVGGMGSAQSAGAESLVFGGSWWWMLSSLQACGTRTGGCERARSGKRRMRAIYSRSCVFDWLIKRSADLVEAGSDIDTEYKR